MFTVLGTRKHKCIGAGLCDALVHLLVINLAWLNVVDSSNVQCALTGLLCMDCLVWPIQTVPSCTIEFVVCMDIFVAVYTSCTSTAIASTCDPKQPFV